MFATPNNNSMCGYPVVDAVKAVLEEVCLGIVSYVDILELRKGQNKERTSNQS
jgi:peroxidase